MLRIEDAETAGSDWKEILYNERINRTNANTNNAYFYIDQKMQEGCYQHTCLIY